MTTIPLAAGMTETEPDAEPTLDVGRECFSRDCYSIDSAKET